MIWKSKSSNMAQNMSNLPFPSSSPSGRLSPFQLILGKIDPWSEELRSSNVKETT